MIVNTLYADHNGDMSDINDIHLRWRDGKQRKLSRISSHTAIFQRAKLMIGAKDNTATYLTLCSYQTTKTLWIVNRISPLIRKPDEPIVKVILNKPWMARLCTKSQAFIRSRCSYEDRYLIDNVNEITSYKMRKLFIDLEALQFGEGDWVQNITPRTQEPRDFQEINVMGLTTRLATKNPVVSHSRMKLLRGERIRQRQGSGLLLQQ